MPQCTEEERKFLDFLKKDFNEYRTASPDEWEEDDEPSDYYIEDVFYTLDRHIAEPAREMLKQWAQA